MWEKSGVRSPRPGKKRKDKLAKPTCAEYLRHKREPIRSSGEIRRWGKEGGHGKKRRVVVEEVVMGVQLFCVEKARGRKNVRVCVG